MGIDVYMRWKGQTDEEKKEQYTGFSVRHGFVGYLREAYHGEPFATRALVPEAFDENRPDNQDGVPIPAATLRERLSKVMELARTRERVVYKGTKISQELAAQSFADFVALA